MDDPIAVISLALTSVGLLGSCLRWFVRNRRDARCAPRPAERQRSPKSFRQVANHERATYRPVRHDQSAGTLSAESDRPSDPARRTMRVVGANWRGQRGNSVTIWKETGYGGGVDRKGGRGMNSWVLSGLILAGGAVASVGLWLLLDAAKRVGMRAAEQAAAETAAEEQEGRRDA